MKLRTQRFAAISAALVCLAAVAFAQAGPRAELVWVDDPSQVRITDAQNRPVRADLGQSLGVGFTIQTMNSGAEIVLQPNRSVIKIAANTSFRIDGLQGGGGASNDFTLNTGRMRIAAVPGGGNNYTLRTRTAVGGVRGTDFYRHYEPGVADWICVTEGSVQFDPVGGGQGVLVNAGFFVDATKGFTPSQPSAEWLRNNLTLETFQRAVPPPRR